MSRPRVFCALPERWRTATLPFTPDAFRAELRACPTADVVFDADDGRPAADLVVWVPGEDEDPYATLGRLHARCPGVPVAAWLLDDPAWFDVTYALPPAVASLYTNDANAALACHAPNVRHLPAAACQLVAPGDSTTPPAFDAAFLLDGAPSDASLLAFALASLPEGARRVAVTPGALAPGDLSGGGITRLADGGSGQTALLRHARRARVVVRVASSPRHPANTLHRLLPASPDALTFAIAEAGVPQVTPLRFPSLLDAFARGTEIACFSTAAEFADGLRRLLVDEGGRAAVAAAARARVRREHLYRHRLAEILRAEGLTG
ncbi:MAG TPA: glycosyltransferase [Armatimonadaceae bacterium]|nr:glycosyltransferase [Armatimonadaceae bacterium]